MSVFTLSAKEERLCVFVFFVVLFPLSVVIFMCVIKRQIHVTMIKVQVINVLWFELT